MTTVAEWLAEQEAAARGRANDQRPNSTSEHWHRAQAAAYEAAHAYAVARPDASAPPTPTPDAGSDLAKLSEAATPGLWRIGTTRRDNPDLLERSPIVPAISPDRPYAGMIWRGTGLTKEEDAAFVVTLVNAYRAGRLIEASASQPPAEDLAGQGEPVAWAYEYRENGRWREFLSGLCAPAEAANIRNIRPLYAAPASSRPADRNEDSATLDRIRSVLPAHLTDADSTVQSVANAVRGAEFWNGEAMRLSHELADVPQGVPIAHLREVTDADVEWLAREAIRTNSRPLARIAAALLVGRT